MIAFDLVNKYSNDFLGDNWRRIVRENCKKEIKRAKFQGDLLCRNVIIYNDPMDMEATSVPYIFDGVDWNKTANFDPEWTFMLSRNGFMVDLAISYRLTEDKKYLEKWKEYLFSFIKYNGNPSDYNKDTWRTLDTGIRLSNWMRSLIYLGNDLELSNEELEKFEESLKIHLEFLYEAYKPKELLSNWGILLITGVLSVSILFPDLVDEEHRKWAWDLLEDQLNIQFYQDGIQWEQSPMYHHEVVLSITYVMMHAEYTKQYIPLDIREKLKPLVAASQFYIKHNEKLLSLNDSDNVDFSYVYSIYRCLGLSSEAPSKNEKGILFVGSMYENKYIDSKNVSVNGCFKQIDSGFLAYKDNNHLITLFNGRHGSAHGHASLGSMTITLNKIDIVGDPGRFTYRNDSPLRTGLKKQWMHNTVDVDDKEDFKISGDSSYDEVQDPIGSIYNQKGNYIALEGIWSGKADMTEKEKIENSKKNLYTIKRTVFLENKMNVVLVFTEIDYPGEHKWRSIYNIEPTARCIYEEEKNVVQSENMSFIVDVLEGDPFVKTKSIFSNKYNHLCNNDKLVSSSSFIDRGVKVEAFYEKNTINIRPLYVHQNGKSEQAEKDKMIGFEVKSLKDDEEFSIFYCGFDTFKGNKIYYSEKGQGIFGKLTIFDKDNKRIKLL
ncbi:heparinase II/III family protein [Clostridium tertium]|uniref:heparinase II/III family protein n=1 Tax=Clostridium tertium TaxID=1559 RepID=UPI00232DDB37|nr:heparinase II/III family protein [Clostridium tertium]MDB1921652.1 heparinase II/III family protein [Clostridium tertium]MDB1924856.1 heparinase II/III family protein [Clostridium tertium]MDB1930537.1 heparinase II/III family protein [Clostridium tertium]